MKKVFASVSLLALGAAGAATIAAGADNGDKPWSVTGSLRGFYDDNINTAPNHTPGKVSSLGVEVKPGASLDFDWGATKLQASYLYDMRYYDQRHNTDQSHDIEFNLDHNISERYALNLSDSFVIAQEPDVIAGTGAFATPIRSNGNNVRNTASINFRAQLTRLFGLVFGYANNFLDYQESFGTSLDQTQPSRSAVLDRDEHQFHVDTTWQVAPETTAILGYSFGAIYYSSAESILNDPIPAPGSGSPPYPYAGSFFVPSSSRDNYAHGFYLGLDHAFLPELTGSIRAGLQYIDYYNDVNLTTLPVLQRQSHSTLSPYVDMTLSYMYMKDGILKFGFRHAHNQTDVTATTANLGAGVTLDEESSVVYGSISQKLTPISPRLSGTLTAQYQNSVWNQGPGNGSTENLYLLGLGLNYQFNQYLSAECGYNYDLVRSDLQGRGYQRNQIFVGVGVMY